MNTFFLRKNFPIHRAVWVALIGMLAAGSASGAVSFPAPFSPDEGITAPIEQPWRQEICLNGSWEFQPVPLPANYDLKQGTPVLPEPTPSGWSKTPIRIPSPWNINGESGRRYMAPSFPSYPKEWGDARMGWLRRPFTVPAAWQGKRIVLHFEAILGYAQIFVNGQQLAANFENSLPFEVDITEVVQPGTENTLMVGIRQASLFNVPGKYGKLTYAAGPPPLMMWAGIWQDVFLRALPPLRVEEVVVRPWVNKSELELIVTVRNHTPTEQAFRLGGEIRPWINQAGRDVISAPTPKWSLGDSVLAISGAAGTVVPTGTTVLTLRQPIKGELDFWTPDTPNLYGLVLDILQDNQTQDRCYERFGWRQWGIQGRDVTLNGKPIQLLGDAVTFGGISNLSRRYVWARYKTLKEVGANAARLHVVVRPRYYLEMADEMGLAILDESEVWASAMDYNYEVPDTFKRIDAHVEGLVRRDRNYASVFGWSICNEILSALWFKGVPRELWPPVIDNVVALADKVRALDPTRAWISSDGDGDFQGRLPTYVYHYGKPSDWLRDAPKDRPFGLGEAGSMLWGSPAVFSVYNGERSFESYEGMMEGAAIETYEYLTKQRQMGAAFCSTFTFEGMAFDRMPFGMADPNGMPKSEDGVVFGPLVEGKPGYQPERLGPFAMPFNPGFDPNLPLYQPTVIHEAYVAAFAPGGPKPSKWDHRVESAPLPKPPPATIKQVAFVGDLGGNLASALQSSGVPIVAQGVNAPANLLVIDGATLTSERVPVARDQIQNTLSRKGSVFIWASSENLNHVNALLPAAVSLHPTRASGLYADRNAPETAAISLASLYFNDQSDQIILKSGLAGPLVERSRVLMRGNTVARRWFSSGSAQTQSPALIATEVNGGRLLVTSLTADVSSEKRLELLRNLYANLGVALQAPSDVALDDSGFDGAGYVNAALIAGSFQIKGERYPKILERDFLGNEPNAQPRPGDKAGERTWIVTRALGDGTFDFGKLKLPGTDQSHLRSLGNELKPEALDANGYLETTYRVFHTQLPGLNSVAYLSFWIHAPEATSIEKQQLSLVIRCDDGVKIWINQKESYADRSLYGPGLTDSKRVPVALNAGWNHFLVKSATLDGPWFFGVRFESADQELLSQLRASATKPAS